MPDACDEAQDTYEANMEAALSERKRAREALLKNPPFCENYDDRCTGKRFVTEKGTLARFCKDCLEEYKASFQP